MKCFESNKTLYDLYATVVFNLYSFLVFAGEFLVLVPSHLPHLRLLRLEYCHSLCDKYVEELVAAVPELKIIK